MTIGDLIAELGKHPPETPVVVLDRMEHLVEIEDAYFIPERTDYFDVHIVPRSGAVFRIV